MRQLMARLLPVGVVSRETETDVAGSPPYPEEAAVVSRAVEQRRREFVTTRACARAALAELGFSDVPIPRGRWSRPVWPEGVAGSLTHCEGYRAAAVAWQKHYCSIGIDAEPRAALPEDILNVVTDAQERAHLASLGEDDPSVPWDRLLFSAKESVYKAWFPLTGRWLGFTDASVCFSVRGSFSAGLRVEGPVVDGARVRIFKGRWGIDDGHVATAVVVR